MKLLREGQVFSERTPDSVPFEDASEIFHSLLHEHGQCNRLPGWFDTAWKSEQFDPDATCEARVDGITRSVPVKYAGTLVTRVSKYAKVNFGVELDREQLGNRLRQAKLSSESVKLDFVNLGELADIPWRAGDFGDSGSCYWCEYTASRAALVENNCWAVRTYGVEQEVGPYAHPPQRGTGRAWLLPWSTADWRQASAQDADSVLVWNGYAAKTGHCGGETQAIARILLATQRALDTVPYTLTRVEFYNLKNDTIPYINNNTGYLLHPSTLTPRAELRVRWECAGTTCIECGNYINDDDAYVSDDGDGPYCESCYCERYTRCDKCNNEVPNDDTTEVNGLWYCETCYDILFTRCEECDTLIRKQRDEYTECAGDIYCETCAEKLLATCAACGDTDLKTAMVPDADEWYCAACFDEGSAICDICQHAFYAQDGSERCPACHTRYMAEQQLLLGIEELFLAKELQA